MADEAQIDLTAPATLGTVLVLFALALEAIVCASAPWRQVLPIGLVIVFVLPWLQRRTAFVGALALGLALGEGLGAALSVPPALLFTLNAHHPGVAPWLSSDTFMLRLAAVSAALGGARPDPGQGRAVAAIVVAAGLFAALPGALGGRPAHAELRDHAAEQLGPAYAGYELYVVDKDWVGTADAWLHRYDVIAYGDRDARRLTVEWTTPRSSEAR